MELTKESFDTLIHGDEQPVMVAFWAQWCGPCRMMAPVVDRLAETFKGRMPVGKVNVDDEQELAEHYRISSIPTVLILTDGEVRERLIGARPYDDMAKIVQQYLEA